MVSAPRHLFKPLFRSDPSEPIPAYRRDLEEAHDFVARLASQHEPPAMCATWGSDVKRSPVLLTGAGVGAPPRLVGVQSQPFGEIVNQLATVERLLDALRWAFGDGMRKVEECHPSTSYKRGYCSHDLVVADEIGTRMVFEVSDVAGRKGNENRKMTRDLATLQERCTCHAQGGLLLSLLAVSDSSAVWLSGQGLGRERWSGQGTRIIEIRRLPGTPVACQRHGTT